MDTGTICPECMGIDPVSYNDYLEMDKKGIWTGGWIYGPDGTVSYAAASARVTGSIESSTCPQHGAFNGDSCPFGHVGGDAYCDVHSNWYNSELGCSGCVTVTGYCDVHNEYYNKSLGCSDCATNDNNSGAVSGSINNTHKDFCPIHQREYEGFCQDCSNGDNNHHSGGTVNPDILPSIDSIVDKYTDSTFNETSKKQLKDAFNIIEQNEIGKWIRERIYSPGEFVKFTIGETQYRVDVKTGEKYQVPAQYANNLITFNPSTEIGYGNLGEELIHAAQHDLYGKSMVAENLNFEFEAKVIDCMLTGVYSAESLGFSTEDGIAFEKLSYGISNGSYDSGEIQTEYKRLFEKWAGEGYTDQEGYEKYGDFDPRLLKEIASRNKK